MYAWQHGDILHKTLLCKSWSTKLLNTYNITNYVVFITALEQAWFGQVCNGCCYIFHNLYQTICNVLSLTWDFIWNASSRKQKQNSRILNNSVFNRLLTWPRNSKVLFSVSTFLPQACPVWKHSSYVWGRSDWKLNKSFQMHDWLFYIQLISFAHVTYSDIPSR